MFFNLIAPGVLHLCLIQPFPDIETGVGFVSLVRGGKNPGIHGVQMRLDMPVIGPGRHQKIQPVGQFAVMLGDKAGQLPACFIQTVHDKQAGLPPSVNAEGTGFRDQFGKKIFFRKPCKIKIMREQIPAVGGQTGAHLKRKGKDDAARLVQAAPGRAEMNAHNLHLVLRGKLGHKRALAYARLARNAEDLAAAVMFQPILNIVEEPFPAHKAVFQQALHPVKVGAGELARHQFGPELLHFSGKGFALAHHGVNGLKLFFKPGLEDRVACRMFFLPVTEIEILDVGNGQGRAHFFRRLQQDGGDFAAAFPCGDAQFVQADARFAHGMAGKPGQNSIAFRNAGVDGASPVVARMDVALVEPDAVVRMSFFQFLFDAFHK